MRRHNHGGIAAPERADRTSATRMALMILSSTAAAVIRLYLGGTRGMAI